MQYAGNQMQYALGYLAVHRHTRLVTIGIGANDVLLCQETTADASASTAELKAVLQEIRANLTTIYTEIRDVAAASKGRLRPWGFRARRTLIKLPAEPVTVIPRLPGTGWPRPSRSYEGLYRGSRPQRGSAVRGWDGAGRAEWAAILRRVLGLYI